MLNNSKDDSIKNTFKNIRIVEGIKQPQNIVRLVTSTSYNDPDNHPNTNFANAGLYAECTDKRCNLCYKGYIQQCSSFITANGETWTIKSHINCNSKNVLYYLKCNMCKTDIIESNTGKTETRLRDRMNNHISDTRTGRTTDKFDLHVHQCGINNHCLKPPFFKVYAFMKFTSSRKLITYERYLHKKRYDTMNK